MTVLGLVLGASLTSTLDGAMRAVLPIILFGVGTGSLLLVRFVVLPQIARRADVQPQALASVGYAFAESPAIYGLVAAVMTGAGWLALPFGALAVVGWLSVRAFIAAHRVAAVEDFPSAEDFPRL
jgi:hypothetical protein